MIDQHQQSEASTLVDGFARNSSKTRHAVLAHKIDMENRLYGDTWRSCCGLIIDRRLLVYVAQLSIILLIISFCIVQLMRLDECSDQQAYLGLLTLLIGILCPSPALSRNTNKSSDRPPYDDQRV